MSRKKAGSPVMSLAATVKNEAIKVSCDVESKELFSVFGNKKKGIPMKACADIVNKEYSARKIHGVSLKRNDVSVVDASKALIEANNSILEGAPISAKYMETFVKEKCAEKHGKTCPI